MGRSVLYWGSALFLGNLLGVASLAAVFVSAQFTSPAIGPWHYNPHIGTQATAPHWRAVIALMGFLALPKEESMYFNSMHDDDGELLRRGCTYRIEAPEFPARWWSVTVYSKSGYLMDNAEDRYSFNGEQLTRNEEGRYVFRVAPQAVDGAWIPTGEDAYFDLTLRLYNPKEGFWEALDTGTLELPRIIREGCADE